MFFERMVPFLCTLHAHGFVKSQDLRFSSNMAIVETIICDMLFDLDDVHIFTQQGTFCAFKATVEVGSSNAEGNAYPAEVKSMKRFQLMWRLLVHDDSLRDVFRQRADIREETGMAGYGVASGVTVSYYVW